MQACPRYVGPKQIFFSYLGCESLVFSFIFMMRTFFVKQWSFLFNTNLTRLPKNAEMIFFCKQDTVHEWYLWMICTHWPPLPPSATFNLYTVTSKFKLDLHGQWDWLHNLLPRKRPMSNNPQNISWQSELVLIFQSWSSHSINFSR